jgi:hypothetical protein
MSTHIRAGFAMLRPTSKPPLASISNLLRGRPFPMPDPDFVIEILATEVVVNHLEDGHIFRFPIMPNGTVSLNGSRIEPNPKAKREARRYLFESP